MAVLVCFQAGHGYWWLSPFLSRRPHVRGDPWGQAGSEPPRV